MSIPHSEIWVNRLKMKISMPCWVVIGNITQDKVQGSPPPQNQHNIGGYVKTEPRSSVVLDAWLVNDVSHGQLYVQLNKPSHAGCLKWISTVLSRKKSTCLTHCTLFLGLYWRQHSHSILPEYHKICEIWWGPSTLYDFDWQLGDEEGETM